MMRSESTSAFEQPSETKEMRAGRFMFTGSYHGAAPWRHDAGSGRFAASLICGEDRHETLARYRVRRPVGVLFVGRGESRNQDPMGGLQGRRHRAAGLSCL